MINDNINAHGFNKLNSIDDLHLVQFQLTLNSPESPKESILDLDETNYLITNYHLNLKGNDK